jgi:phosphoglycerate dehydrogenase-like enzyme
MPQHELEKMVLFHQVGFSLWDMSDERVGELRRLFPDIQFVSVTDLDTLAREVVDADALCSMRITPGVFHSARRLKWIHSVAAGVGGLMIPGVLKSEIFITNARGIFSTVMAEHTLGVMLAFSRRLIDSYRFQQQHQWAREELWNMRPQMGEIAGKVVGIIGYGSIGHEIATRARAFGMTVCAVKKNLLEGTEDADRVYPPSELVEVLRQSDFIIVALPHTPETKNFIGEAELCVMKASAYLINIGRGKLIDEMALMRALEGGRLAGAALDVFETEPLPADHPLWDQQNILITPHCSGNFPQYWDRSRALLCRNIRRFREGRELLNLVDKKRGY